MRIPEPFVDATPLLDDPQALRAQFAESGYLYVPGAVDTNHLKKVRDDILDVLRNHRWLTKNAEWLLPARAATVEGDDDYLTAYSDIQLLESFHRVPHLPEITQLMDSLFGAPNFPHPLSIARLCFPDATDFATPAHQDFPNNQGTTELHAIWIPLHDCPVRRGPLQILEGSQHLGLLPVDAALGAGAVEARVKQPELQWHSSDMKLGDVLIFNSLTVHRAAPNQTKEFRLSVDYRFQPSGAALTPGSLLPHFNAHPWDHIYNGWKCSDLDRYWEAFDYTVEPFDPDLRSANEASVLRMTADQFKFTIAQYELSLERGWTPSPELEAAAQSIRTAINSARKSSQG